MAVLLLAVGVCGGCRPASSHSILASTADRLSNTTENFSSILAISHATRVIRSHHKPEVDDVLC